MAQPERSLGNLKWPGILEVPRGREHKAILLTRTLEPCPAFYGVEPSWFKDQRHRQGHSSLFCQDGEVPTLNLLGMGTRLSRDAMIGRKIRGKRNAAMTNHALC